MSMDLVKCSILMLLYEHQSLHGYALMEMLQTRLGRTVSPAIIYPFLATLLQAGNVALEREAYGGRKINTEVAILRALRGNALAVPVANGLI